MRVGPVKILISQCVEGVYLRWWYNGWHYYNFTNGYDLSMRTQSMGTQVTNFFSVISKIERPTKLKAEFAYNITVEGIRPADIGGFLGLLMAEKVEQYEEGYWREVFVTRGTHLLRETEAPSYIFNFEITREDLACQSSVVKKAQKLYLDYTLCDLDDDEPVPINKQVNDISEMQDRQSDFTAQFRIRKTRLMKELYELSGEVGISTLFPYRRKTARLVQDGIEIITNGNMILDKVDDQYYYVAVYSGNISFFGSISEQKITDLTLASTNHYWDSQRIAGSHIFDRDYCYPLMEPSNDAGMTPAPPNTADYIQLYGGWIWPFIKVKAIWDEIFANAGYTAEGDILTDGKFLSLFMPIANLDVPYIDKTKYLYSLLCQCNHLFDDNPEALNCSIGTVTLYVGDGLFAGIGMFRVVYGGTYTFRVRCVAYEGNYGLTVPEYCYLYIGGVQVQVSTGDVRNYYTLWDRTYTFTQACLAGESVTFWVSYCGLRSYYLQVVSVEDLILGYNNYVYSHYHLPDLTQTDFIKTICNLFGLIPETNNRDRKVRFWNYQELYDNIPIARDWSAYLSEREDESEFRFGDYAQKNYMRYAESEDVVKDTGIGMMEIDDENLKAEKDVVELDVSTCDEVLIYDETVPASRINFNDYDTEAGTYTKNKSIDPRIVLIERLPVSPPSANVFELRETEAPIPIGTGWYSITDPKYAKSQEISFTALSEYYNPFKRMLDKANLRRCKFSLPAYEVAGFKHNVPIYVRQYKAYFYVNKISNYVPGMLCTIEMIKL